MPLTTLLRAEPSPVPLRLMRAGAIGILLVALGGCAPTPEELANGGDPLAALEASHPSDRYSVEFWAREYRRGTSLWATAKDFCRDKDEATAPNCVPVRLVLYWESPPPRPRPRAWSFQPPAPKADPGREVRP